jgi:TorA maturation chaperone TorD
MDKARLVTLQRGAAELMENRALWEKEPFAEALLPLLELLADMDPKSAEKLTREHTRLFTVKPLTPPYESLYTAPHAEGRGWVIAQLERVYARNGLAISELNELPDHLAVELEFMSFLCEQEVVALQAEDAARGLIFFKAQESFLVKHLLRWVPSFSKKVRGVNPDSTYGLVLKALESFLRSPRLCLYGVR